MSRLRSRELVGRARELAMFDALIADVAAGQGAVVLVRGEAGVGKSRLLAEVVRRAGARGVTTLAGRAVEGGGPYRPLSDALLARQRTAALPPPVSVGPFAGAVGRLVPGWVSTPVGELLPDLPLLVSEGLVRLLRQVGEPGGVLLALDDLQWADADTRMVVDRLAEAAGDAGVLVLLAARPERVEVLERIARTAHVIDLRKLDRAEVAELATACAGGEPLPEAVRRHVVEHADGLPFLVEELLGGLVDAGVLVRSGTGWEAPETVRGSVPASFASVVRRRLEALDAPARVVVEAAAVLGRRVDWRLLAPMTGRTDAAVLDALRDAVEHQLLEPDGLDLFRFTHALTREAVLDRLLPPQRAGLAGAAARALDEGGTELERAADLYGMAGDGDRAAGLLRRAAQHAGDALATREQLLRRAVALAPADDAAAAALAEVLVPAGRVAEAREVGDGVLARLPTGDPARRSLALTLARASVVASRWPDAERYLDQVEDDAARDALAAHVAFGRQRPADADRLARAVLEAAPADPAVVCEAMEVVGRCARLWDRRADAEAAFVTAAEVADAHGLRVWRIRALVELGTLDLLGLARPDRLVEARDLAVAAGLLSTAAVVDLQIAACYGLRMDHAATLEVGLRGAELAESLRLPVVAAAALLFVATAHAHTGRLAEMSAVVTAATERAGDEADQVAMVRFVRGLPAMLAHDLAAWLESLRAGVALLRESPAAAPSPFLGMHVLVETVLGDGRSAREALRASGATAQAANRAALSYADAVAAGRTGADPQQYLAAAEEAMAPLEWRRHHARLLVAPAAMRDGWGSPVEWLLAANGHFAASGDERLARACRDLLRAAGAPVPRRGRGDSTVPAHLRAIGVTSRETDVLVLVAEGLGNTAIAGRLVLSTRTVETHIASLLRKTGASDRGELANYVAAHG